MKIVWHSNAPWSSTGYGQQTALFTPLLRDLGHDIVISAFYGLTGGALTWNGITVVPGSTKADQYGAQILAETAKREQADLVITLTDIWVLSPDLMKPLNVAHWMPVDCTPLSILDKYCLETSGARPIAMSRFGEATLRDAGFDPLYVPHGIDDVYLGDDLPSTEDARAEVGVPDGVFTIGINAANKDGFRKGMYEQLAAFARLHERHPDTALLFHGKVSEVGALDVSKIADRLGILTALRASDQYACETGQFPVEKLATWYRALDLYSCCSLGEGFGIPVVEAQACGVPVVVTDASAMPELAGAGWKVPGHPFWNPSHHALWCKPDIDEIHKVYERAYQRAAAYRTRKTAAREFASRYACDRVLKDHWVPALAALEAGLTPADQ